MYRFVWKIQLTDSADEEAFINHWREGSAVLQEYAGAKGTLLHKVRDEDRAYFAVAQWESQEARDAMQADIENKSNPSEQAKKWQSFATNESFGAIISFAGEEISSIEPIDKSTSK